MVVDDLDLIRPRIGPSEADTILIVDPHGVLAYPIALELLEPQPRERQGLKRVRRVQLVEYPRRAPMKVPW